MASNDRPPLYGLAFKAKVDAVPIINTNITLLSTLTLDNSQVLVGSAQGTVIGTVQGLTQGSMLLLTNSNFGAVQLVSGKLQVGPTPSGVSSFNIQLTEILSGAPPSITTIFVSIVAIAVPVIITLPLVSGAVQVGQTLTATTGTWTNTPLSFAYQWNRAGMQISGATGTTYVQIAADVGHAITVSVTAFNGAGASFAATSMATNDVIDVVPTINTAASIPGTPNVGIPTTAIDAIWNNSVTSRAYQWKVAGVNGTGAGATTLTYTPVIGDVGSTLTLTVTASNSGGPSAPSTSAASAAVSNTAASNSTPYVVLLAA